MSMGRTRNDGDPFIGKEEDKSARMPLHGRRAAAHRDICAALEKFPRESSNESLRAQGALAAPAGKTSDKLGSGVYGSVTKAVVSGHPVAVKHVSAALGRKGKKKKEKENGSEEDELLLGSLLREDVACAYLSGLVLGMVCPNFMLVHRGFISKNVSENKMEFLMISELANGTLAQWLRSARKKAAAAAGGACVLFGSPEQILPLVLQLCMAVCAAASALDISHNDLYFKNVLWIPNTASSQKIRYALGGQQQQQQRYCVVSPILLLVGDLGISSSPKVLENDHDSLQRRMHSRKKVPGVSRLADVRFDRHILEYVDLPPLKRDLAIVFHSFLEGTSLPQGGTAAAAEGSGGGKRPMALWLAAALAVLDDATVETPDDLVHVVEVIFSKESLRAAGIRETIVHEDPAVELSAGILPPVYDVLRPDAHAVAQAHALEYILRSREAFISPQRHPSLSRPPSWEGTAAATTPLQTVRSPVSYRSPSAGAGREREKGRVTLESAALILSVALDPMRI